MVHPCHSQRELDLLEPSLECDRTGTLFFTALCESAVALKHPLETVAKPVWSRTRECCMRLHGHVRRPHRNLLAEKPVRELQTLLRGNCAALSD